MYRAYDFTFAGVSASMYGMYVADIGNKKHGDHSFGNVANIVETRIANRVTPIHYGVRYHDEPLTFTLIFGADRVLDRYELQEISKWLTGYQEYQWLSIDQPDLEHIQFRCLVESLTPISMKWMPMAFEAKIVCDCPYGYSYPFEKTYVIHEETAVLFYNDGSSRVPLKPIIEVSLAQGCTELTITNHTTGETVRFYDLPSGGISFVVDSENEVVAAEDVTDIYECFNYVFPSFVAGDNRLTITGDGIVKLSGRFLYNVGA